MRKKISTQLPPAPTASTVGPCPTLIQISRTPRHWKLTQHHRTTRPPQWGWEWSGGQVRHHSPRNSGDSQQLLWWMGTLPWFITFFPKGNKFCDFLFNSLGPVVQSIVTLTSSLSGQLVKCFTTLSLNILIFFVEKNERSFCIALQKLLTFFQQKILAYLRYIHLKF